MDLERYRGDLTTMIRRLKSSDLSNLLLVVVVAMLSYKNVTTHERIALTPMSLDSRMTVGWDSADSSYYEKAALFIATLMGNVNPDNVSFVREQIRRMCVGSLYTEMDSRLEEDVQSIQMKGQSVSFVANNVFYDEKLGKTFVVGTQRLSSKTGAQIDEKVSYEFEIQIDKGLPSLRSYDLYRGEPHDSSYLYSRSKQQ